ncbi:MAG: MetQ/NlpA family ABC transporter substrate-binding protein [Succinivibrio sp.]|jgi:D-methionine transport system substrate-binding protein|nr:MetQ/NlpA family ABC transporter substrate-binding protein [Succinivibrio sp.]
MKNLFKSTVLAAAAAALAFGLAGCGDKQEAKSESAAAAPEVKIGVVGENNGEWEIAKKTLEGQGIKLTIVKFADYTLPNRALHDKEIDLNAFQHVAFLKAENEQKGFNNVGIGDTLIAPLGAYSQKIKSLDELKDGDTVALPNDPTNGGRALKLLELAGVIKLDASKGYIPTVRDVTDNPKHIKFYEVDAGNTPSLLPDVAVSIINSNYALDNHLNPMKDAIFSDTTGKIDKSNPYINVIAARAEDKDNPVYQKVVKAFQTKEVAEYIKNTYKGASVPAFSY